MTGNTQQVLMWLFDMDKDAVWDIEPHKERKGRSLNANSYFHVLVQKLAQAQQPPVSLAKCKNMMIAAYGQPEYIGKQQAIIKSNVPVEKMQEVEYLHTACVKVSEENGAEVYFYRVYRGSHTYTVEEMQKLIEGVVQECKDAGIETATPAEIAKMIDVWGLKNERRMERN